jgi:hypothetical protein
MVKVKPSKPRATITSGPKGLEIVIPAKRNVFLILFLSVWLVGWAVGEVTVPMTFFKCNTQASALMFTAVWLVFWTIGGAFAIYVWLWNLAGKERVTINNVSLIVKHDLFSYGREKEYEVSYISNLRVSPQPFSPFNFSASLQFWGVGGNVIAFDYGAKTYRFGSLDEAEAAQIIEKIKARYKL